MKKQLFTVVLCLLFANVLLSQDAAPPKAEEFDKKWRLGLRVTPQPCWFATAGKNNIPSGAKMGIGFGLNVEYRFSQVVGLLTGIGGDFEGGNYKFKSDPAGNFEPMYYMDSEELIEPSAGANSSSALKYTVKDRRINTTHVTIPLILKLSTQEYSGIKYFGMFGAELGIRAKATANDTYYEVVKEGPLTSTVTTGGKVSNINIRDETSLIPARLGLNAGLGFDYRLGGSTSIFFSANYFYSFTNLMRKTSDFTYYRVETDGTHRFLDQSIKQNAIRLNIGIMF